MKRLREAGDTGQGDADHKEPRGARAGLWLKIRKVLAGFGIQEWQSSVRLENRSVAVWNRD